MQISTPILLELDQAPRQSCYRHCIWEFSLEDTEIPDVVSNLENFDYNHEENYGNNTARKFFQNDSKWLETYNSMMHTVLVDLIANLDNSNYNTFKNSWGWISPENLVELGAHTNIFYDSGEFSMGKHLDNRKTVFAAILNLTNNESTTKFWDYRDPEKLLFNSSGVKGHGIIFMNSAGSLHNVEVTQQLPRITAQTQLSLRIR
jgi:hypothetical protein